MKRILSRLYRTSPREITNYISTNVRFLEQDATDNVKAEEIAELLRRQFTIFQTPNLRSIGAEDFSNHIQSSIGKADVSSEVYSKQDIEYQRDLSIKFHWGHNHDFGDFGVKGRMGDRHITLLANFLALFPVSLEDFTNKISWTSAAGLAEPHCSWRYSVTT